MMKFSAIILAAGSGKRTGLKYNKILYEIKGKKVLDYSIEKLKKNKEIQEIILVVSDTELNYFNEHYVGIVNHIVVGGKERQESVFNGLSVVSNDFVIIHDGARPFIPQFSLNEIFSAINDEQSITLGVSVKDSIQEVGGNRVVRSLDRSNLIAVQTPQAFWTSTIKQAHALALADGFLGTDDTVLIERYLDIKAMVVKGDYRNIKLTTLDDAKLLEVIL